MEQQQRYTEGPAKAKALAQWLEHAETNVRILVTPEVWSKLCVELCEGPGKHQVSESSLYWRGALLLQDLHLKGTEFLALIFDNTTGEVVRQIRWTDDVDKIEQGNEVPDDGG